MGQVEESRRAMATWLGTLAKGGLIDGEHAEAGVAVASYVVGEHKLLELRSWLAEQARDVVAREVRAAIEVCIWMAHADREVDEEERWMLKQIIESCSLLDEAREDLIDQTQGPPSLARLEKR